VYCFSTESIFDMWLTKVMMAVSKTSHQYMSMRGRLRLIVIIRSDITGKKERCDVDVMMSKANTEEEDTLTEGAN
jgi:hypothetical protein